MSMNPVMPEWVARATVYVGALILVGMALSVVLISIASAIEGGAL